MIDAVKAGSSARAAVGRVQVSASTAVKWVQRKRQTGSVEAKPMHGHPPPKLAPDKDWLFDLLTKESDLTLKQICERLAAKSIHVGKSSLHSFFKQNRPDVKKRREAWRRVQPWIDPGQLVFLDGATQAPSVRAQRRTGFATKLTELYGRAARSASGCSVLSLTGIGKP